MRGTMKKIREFFLGLMSVWPILRRALATRQFFSAQCQLSEAHPDVLAEWDIHIPLADGTFLLAQIFRSKRAEQNGESVPAIVCAHPYDNHLTPAQGNTPFGGAPIQYRLIPQVGKPRFSKQTSWEAPDPNFWIPGGYCIVNINLPGYGGSSGKATVFSDHQTNAYYEAIEWVARQPWCNGNVGLNGVSFLAITQYRVAADRRGAPAALKCIVPWEGFSDIYRDVLCPGGMEDQGFARFWWTTEVRPALTGSTAEFIRNNGGTPPDLMAEHPFLDSYWQEKIPDLERIRVPMLVCASFSDHGLHTTGSFRAFERAGSKHKWLYTHRSGKWDVFYSDEVQRLTKEFMDCFLKGETGNGFLQRAPVRLEVRASRDIVHAVREEHAWPLPRTQFRPLYLQAENGGLLSVKPAADAFAEHDAVSGRSEFFYKFAGDTELTGPMKLRLWVEAQGSSDMGLFIAVDKLDHEGKSVRFYGSVGNREDMVTRGFCRASRRELDETRSKPYQPVISGQSEQPLKAGEIVAVDIALEPSATFFRSGESLKLIISTRPAVFSPPYAKQTSYNRGKHRIHTGGKYDSFLLIPVVPHA